MPEGRVSASEEVRRGGWGAGEGGREGGRRGSGTREGGRGGWVAREGGRNGGGIQQANKTLNLRAHVHVRTCAYTYNVHI